MKITLALPLAATLALCPAVARANALTPDTTKAATPEALPSGAKVVSLDVQPAKVSISGKYETAQLVVTAKLADGATADVTRLAKYFVACDGVLAEVTPTGQVRPLRNGVGALVINSAGQKATIPITVADIVEAQPVDFIRDVNPVMTKLGCNAGTCHGAKDGKVGFKLSLRGYDPIYDVRSRSRMTSLRAGSTLLRRTIQPHASESHLGAVPHEGGQRTKTDAKTIIEILRAWIADGAKLES